MEGSSTNGRPASLVRYVFSVPGWQKSMAALLLLSALAGVAAFEAGSRSLDLFVGLVLFGVPGIVAGASTSRLANAMDGRMTLNRSSFLALLAASLMWVLSGAGGLFRLWGPDRVFQGYAVGLGAAFALRIVVMMALSDKRLKKSFAPAAIQPLVGLALLPLFAGGELVVHQSVSTLAAFGGASYFLVTYLDAPMKRALGVSGLDLLKAYMAFRHEGENEEMENLLDEMGESVTVPVTAIGFRTREGALKAYFISTFLHPGPVGEIGGGNLPYHLATSLEEGFGGRAFVFHGAATHDFNTVSHGETAKVAAAAEAALREMEFRSCGAASVRVSGELAKSLTQRFGDGALLLTTNAPEPTEDLEFSVGYSAVSEAKSRGLEEGLFVDAHNSYGTVSATYLGSARSYDVIRTSSEATERALELETGPLRLGTAIADLDSGDVGDLGVRAGVVEVDGQLTAYVLIDGNNMVEGLRDELIAAMDVDEGEVATTDNHAVNVYGQNPVGEEADRSALVEEVASLVEEAVTDLEPVEVGIETRMAEGIRVFGSNRTSQMATALNTMLATGKGLAFAYVGLAALFTLLAFFAV